MNEGSDSALESRSVIGDTDLSGVGDSESSSSGNTRGGGSKSAVQRVWWQLTQKVVSCPSSSRAGQSGLCVKQGSCVALIADTPPMSLSMMSSGCISGMVSSDIIGGLEEMNSGTELSK